MSLHYLDASAWVKCYESICVVASDTELRTAATAEGMTVIDPQASPPLPAEKA
jgi:hypothetical protein